MRSIFLVCIVFLLASFTSCEKKCNEPKYGCGITNNSLIGTWELRSAGGGFSGQTTNYPAGNGRLFVFTANTYKQFEQGNLIQSGEYYLTKGLSMLSGNMEDMIVYDNDTQLRTMIEVKGNELHLELDAMDGGGSKWERQ